MIRLANNDENPTISKQDEQELENLANDIAEHDAPLKTGVLSALSGATLGLSDKLAVETGLMDAETRRKQREQNPTADIIGDILGTTASIVGTGGAGAAVKGTAAAAKAAKGASTAKKIAKGAGKALTTPTAFADKAGRSVEFLTKKGLDKVLKDSGNEKLAREVIKKALPKTAGSAVEGAFYGAGELLKEDAIGRAEFNAENLLYAGGLGSLFGGAMGGALGSVSAVVPVIKNNRVVDFTVETVKDKLGKLRDPSEAFLTWAGATAKKRLDIKKNNRDLYDYFPTYIRKHMKRGDKKEAVFESVNKELEYNGERIGEIIDQTNTKVPANRYLDAQLEALDELLESETKTLAGVQIKNKANAINREKLNLEKKWRNAGLIDSVEINENRKLLGKLGKFRFGMSDGQATSAVIARARYRALRKVVDDAVESVDSSLSKELKDINRDFRAGKEALELIEKKENKDFLSGNDLLLAALGIGGLGEGGELAGLGALGTLPLTIALGKKFLRSDLALQFSILGSLEKTNKKVTKDIAKQVKTFFNKPGKAAKVATTKALINSGLSLKNEEGKNPKKPKNREEAFINITENLQNFTTNPELGMGNLSTVTSNMSRTAPNTSMHLQNTSMRALQFIQNKIPKAANNRGILDEFDRKYMPSSIEMAKFERYLQAVDDPKSVMEDIGNGTVTREQVEALKFVYPELYKEVQEQVMEQLSKGTKIPYNRKISLGILMDLPTDVSLQRENILALQSSFSDQPQQEQAAQDQGAVKSSRKGMESLEFSDREQTNLTKVATR